MSQITPGGGALKIKLSKKRPLKITAGAPGGSQTIPMELEHIPSPKWLDPRSQVDTTSESTLPTRGTGAPLFISPILPGSDLEPLEETPPKRENDLKGSSRYELTKEKEIQGLSKQMQGKQESARVSKPSRKGNGGTLLKEKMGIGDPRMKGEALLEEIIVKQEGGMMTLTLVMMGAGMILLPQTPLSQEKENIKVLNMCMYSKDLLDQKVKRVNLVEQEEMVEMGRILP